MVWPSATMSRRANSVAPVRCWSRSTASRNGISTTRAQVGELGLQRWDGEGAVDGVVAVRIV
jgi:hypothetical protein